MDNSTLIETTSLFPELNLRLIELLRALTPDEWNHATNFPVWKVKDIVVHLLDTSIRRLSLQRDGYRSASKVSIASNTDLARHVTMLADRWAEAFTAVSPVIIIELVEKYQDQLYEFLKGLDPFAPALFGVSWAGEEKSFNWFDIAREYTERWHHQAQVRDALNRPPLFERHLYYPVLDTFMRALPYHFRSVDKPNGYVFCAEIAGEAGGKWFIVRNNGSWEPGYDVDTAPDTTVVIQHEFAWKIFTRWIDTPAAGNGFAISGDERMGKHLLAMTCIILPE